MSADLEFPLKRFQKVINDLESHTNRSASYFANKIVAGIFLRAAVKGDNGVTPKVGVSTIRSDLNEIIPNRFLQIKKGNGRKRGSKIPFRVKHALAVKSLKKQNKSITYDNIVQTAARIVSFKSSTSGYLKSGFSFAGASLLQKALKVKPNSVQYQKSVETVNNADPKLKRLSKAKAAKQGINIEAEAENLVSELIADRPINEAVFFFSQGNPSRLTQIGDKAVVKSANIQLKREEKSAAKVLERSIQKEINKVFK